MVDSSALTLTDRISGPGRARSMLARRLADLICLPSSVIGPQERWLIGDLLFEILRNSDAKIRQRCALRLAGIADAPTAIVKLLAADAFEIAQPLLEKSEALSDFDLMEISRLGSLDHRVEIARRSNVSETVSAALASTSEAAVIAALLKNAGAHLAAPTVNHIVSLAQSEHAYVDRLLERPELRPRGALQLFWACDHPHRMAILKRFAVGRGLMIEAAEDVFAIHASEGGSDPLVSRAIKFIDRRQRDRAAPELSRHQDLEGAIAKLRQSSEIGSLTRDIAHLSNINEHLMRRICDDLGGEPLALLCKSTGLDRQYVVEFWVGLGRGETDLGLERGLKVFDAISVEKAQTVIRYWDWAKLETRSSA